MKLRIEVVGLIMLLVSGCSQSEYQKLVNDELKSGVRQDSILLGIRFGDYKKDFYAHCWELNKKEIISHGPENQNVQYDMEDSAGEPIMMLFYPKFDEENRINRMDIEFMYKGWAPWNDHLFADRLVPEVRSVLEKWYGGNGFIEVRLNDDEEMLWVKVDGNRRITIRPNKDRAVQVRVTDLTNHEN